MIYKMNSDKPLTQNKASEDKINDSSFEFDFAMCHGPYCL